LEIDKDRSARYRLGKMIQRNDNSDREIVDIPKLLRKNKERRQIENFDKFGRRVEL